MFSLVNLHFTAGFGDKFTSISRTSKATFFVLDETVSFQTSVGEVNEVTVIARPVAKFTMRRSKMLVEVGSKRRQHKHKLIIEYSLQHFNEGTYVFANEAWQWRTLQRNCSIPCRFRRCAFSANMFFTFWSQPTKGHLSLFVIIFRDTFRADVVGEMSGRDSVFRETLEGPDSVEMAMFVLPFDACCRNMY